jgi:hypothetical protein
MTSETDIPSLASLTYIPYIDSSGQIPEELQGKIGVYAILNEDKVLQLIGYSRDIYLSLKQHLVRQPQNCYWVKFQIIQRPNRTMLESIKNAWIAENGTVPSGNDVDEAKWNQPIDAKSDMTVEESDRYSSLDELGQSKLLKNIARRVEEKILAELKSRGVRVEIRFNPKLKESGLLDLK